MLPLSPDTITVLEMIAAGSSYEQILAARPDWTYLDIFAAASEVLDAMAQRPSGPASKVADVRKTYPRAYEKWTEEDEQRLRELIDAGLTVAQMAHRLQRQRSAIRSRIVRLNLVGRLSSKEASELERISKLDSARPDPPVDSSGA
jgi:GcrA cell cycle regulator